MLILPKNRCRCSRVHMERSRSLRRHRRRLSPHAQAHRHLAFPEHLENRRQDRHQAEYRGQHTEHILRARGTQELRRAGVAGAHDAVVYVCAE